MTSPNFTIVGSVFQIWHPTVETTGELPPTTVYKMSICGGGGRIVARVAAHSERCAISW